MERLLRLSPGNIFEGVRQPNNFVFMRGWAYLRSVATVERGQHILVFSNGHTERVVAWVEPGGVPIKVPDLPAGVDPSLDRAIDLTGAEYKPTEIAADGKIYMFRFKASGW